MPVFPPLFSVKKMWLLVLGIPGVISGRSGVERANCHRDARGFPSVNHYRVGLTSDCHQGPRVASSGRSQDGDSMDCSAWKLLAWPWEVQLLLCSAHIGHFRLV